MPRWVLVGSIIVGLVYEVVVVEAFAVFVAQGGFAALFVVPGRV